MTEQEKREYFKFDELEKIITEAKKLKENQDSLLSTKEATRASHVKKIQLHQHSSFFDGFGVLMDVAIVAKAVKKDMSEQKQERMEQKQAEASAEEQSSKDLMAYINSLNMNNEDVPINNKDESSYASFMQEIKEIREGDKPLNVDDFISEHYEFVNKYREEPYYSDDTIDTYSVQNDQNEYNHSNTVPNEEYDVNRREMS